MRSFDRRAHRLRCAAALLLVLGACGDDDDSDAGPDEQPSGCEADDRSKPGFVCEDGELVACADAHDHPLQQICSHCGCDDGYECDDESDRCVGARELGDECGNDEQCASSSCGTAAPRVCRVALGAECDEDNCDRCFVSDDGASFCSKPCRNSSTCGAGFVCDREQCVPGCCSGSDDAESCTDPKCPDGFVLNESSSVSACRCDLDPERFHPIGEERMQDAAVAHRFVFIHAGLEHSCAIRDDHALVCWGDKLPPPNLAARPMLSYDTSLSSSMCGVSEEGDAVCDIPTRLGVGDEFGLRDEPSGKFVEVLVEDTFACGLRVDGTLVCWGDDSEGIQTTPSGTFSTFALGTHSGCAIAKDSHIECWGDLSEMGEPPSGAFIAITGDSGGYCAVQREGAVSCWGVGEQLVPPTDVRFRSLDFAGSKGVCGLTEENTIACFGSELPGEPPQGTFLALSVSFSHGCALDAEGKAHCWTAAGRLLDTPEP